ncbi:MAG: poly-gamma-glutamate synthase PgsB, partial [bacterium]
MEFEVVLVAFSLFLLLVSLWIAEYQRHKFALKKIPLRIHVNGTRGKSSVTRLITWGLISGGYKVVGKTTGSAPVIIIDGKEFPIERVGRANIKEQIRVVREACEVGADVIVVECMAIDPELQYISERKIIKSSIGVITNVRD